MATHLLQVRVWRTRHRHRLFATFRTGGIVATCAKRRVSATGARLPRRMRSHARRRGDPPLHLARHWQSGSRRKLPARSDHPVPFVEDECAFHVETAGETSCRQSVFAALADPTRREMLTFLASHGCGTATERATVFPIIRQAVTKHLVTLAESGLVWFRSGGLAMSAPTSSLRCRSKPLPRGWRRSPPNGIRASMPCSDTCARPPIRPRPSPQMKPWSVARTTS